MKRLFINELSNMRDLGGYTTLNGTTTKYNRFIRSEMPQIGNDSINILLNNGITTIIDLRSSKELERKRNPLNNGKFDYYNIDIVGEKAPSKEEDIALGYIKITEDFDNIKKIFKIIANAKGGVLYNCTAGKDRTGIISMLILLLGGVADDDVIADYEVSYTFLRNKIRKIHLDNPDLPYFLGGSKLEYMEDTLKMFYDKYNSVEEYMKKIGISDEEMNIIRGKLLDE